MRKWMGILLALAGCNALADQQSEGIALATLHGTLTLGKDVAPPASNLRVSVLWEDPAYGSVHEPGVVTGMPGRDSFDPPGPCADGQPAGWRLETSLLEQPVRLSTAFPSGFSVELTEPPPAAALSEPSDRSGVSVAYGDLVVYDDRNGNDRLDPSTFAARSPDLIFGSSLGPTPWGVGQHKHYRIVYLTRDDELGAGDGKAGYSLETSEYDGWASSTYSTQRLSEAAVELTLDPTTYAQQMACTVMCKVQAPEFPDDLNEFFAGDVGVRLPSDLAVGTSVWSRQTGDAHQLTLLKCTKEDIVGTTGNSTSYGLEVSLIETQGCTETTSFLIEMIRTHAGATPQLPCTEYGEQRNDFPEDPPRSP